MKKFFLEESVSIFISLFGNVVYCFLLFRLVHGWNYPAKYIGTLTGKGKGNSCLKNLHCVVAKGHQWSPRLFANMIQRNMLYESFLLPFLPHVESFLISLGELVRYVYITNAHYHRMFSISS